MADNLITLRGEPNYWPMEWVNPTDQSDVLQTHGFVHPIGLWITMGGPLSGNSAQKVDLFTHPESSQAHLVMTVVDIQTMGVKNYVPRRDFEAISELMGRRRQSEEASADDETAEAADQADGGEGSDADHSLGTAQTAAG